MAFRDDREAVRARADALERENLELRERVERLEGAAAGARAAGKSGRSAASAPRVLIWVGILVFLGGTLAGFFLLPLSAVAVAGLVGTMLIIAGMVSGLVIVVGPNEALVISGRQRRLADGTRVGYRVVRGGRAMRVPLLERADRISLEIVPIAIELGGVYTEGGAAVGFRGRAAVKISGDLSVMRSAIERFLGRGPDEVGRVARETLEGHVRGAAAVMTVAELKKDRIRFVTYIMDEAEDDLRRLGLVIDTLSLDVRE